MSSRDVVVGLSYWLPGREAVWPTNSCSFPLVVFEEASKPCTTANRACTLCVWAGRREEQDVPLALMRPLLMKMRHILRQRMAQ
jgi:hypothetical protein